MATVVTFFTELFERWFSEKKSSLFVFPVFLGFGHNFFLLKRKRTKKLNFYFLLARVKDLFVSLVLRDKKLSLSGHCVKVLQLNGVMVVWLGCGDDVTMLYC